MAQTDLTKVTTRTAADPEPEGSRKLHGTLMSYLQSWIDGTALWRQEAATDLEYINGRQLSDADRKYLEGQKGRPPMVITNEIRPQAELMAGDQRANDFEYVAVPRGREDRRVASVCTSALKAVYEFSKEARASAKVYDDGTATGLGVAYVGTTLDDADDIVWGDLFIDRINQFSFVFDPWGTAPSFQDGRFMGHLIWMTEDAFREEYPNHPLPPREDWLSQFQAKFGNSTEFGTPTSLQHEMFHAEKGHVRLVHLYYKEMRTVWFVVDEANGDVYEGGSSEQDAKAKLRELAQEQAEALTKNFQVRPQPMDEGVAFLILDGQGQPQLDEMMGQPAIYASEQEATAALTAQTKAIAQQTAQAYTVQRRKVRVVKWADLTAFGVLETGDRDSTSRRFPYAPMVQRQWGDDVRDIEGITRQVRGRQDQINKRNNFIDMNLAHSAHSGWLNKKGDGADTKKLELLGSRPGVVVEYSMVKPEQLQPAQIPVGHFTLLESHVAGLQRSTGINAELLGLTSNSTVSGRAITARQRGGQLILLPRNEAYKDYKLDLAQLVLEEIQLSMPTEKIRRILGFWEAKNGVTQMGESVFKDPRSGEMASDDEILRVLTSFKETRFDVVLKPASPDETVREMKFTRELEIAKLITASGRAIGPALFTELMHDADVSEKFQAAALADLQAEQQALAAQMQQQQIQETLGNQRGRGSGGTNVG